MFDNLRRQLSPHARFSRSHPARVEVRVPAAAAESTSVEPALSTRSFSARAARDPFRAYHLLSVLSGNAVASRARPRRLSLNTSPGWTRSWGRHVVGLIRGLDGERVPASTVQAAPTMSASLRPLRTVNRGRPPVARSGVLRGRDAATRRPHASAEGQVVTRYSDTNTIRPGYGPVRAGIGGPKRPRRRYAGNGRWALNVGAAPPSVLLSTPSAYREHHGAHRHGPRDRGQRPRLSLRYQYDDNEYGGRWSRRHHQLTRAVIRRRRGQARARTAFHGGQGSVQPAGTTLRVEAPSRTVSRTTRRRRADGDDRRGRAARCHPTAQRRSRRFEAVVEWGSWRLA